jgi:hypothetical protein
MRLHELKKKIFYTAKETARRMKRQRENLFANHTSDKRLISKINKEQRQLTMGK